MTEEWRKIPDVPNYSVSSDGRVRNDATGRMLKLYSGHFVRVKSSCGGEAVSCSVKTLVSLVFNGTHRWEGKKSSKLSHEEKEEIRTLLRNGEKQAIIAERFGVTQQAVSKIKKDMAS